MSSDKKTEPSYPYFEERMKLYGITPAVNKIKLVKYDADSKENLLEELPVFSGSERGIDILIYSIDRIQATFKPKDSRWSRSNVITRLEKPFLDAKRKEHKYNIPRGAESLPFFPPALVEKFEKKEKIKTLVATEGYFKAFKASMYGLDILAFSSISTYKEKDKGTLHSDIIRLIQTCEVENFIWLADGDANRISLKRLADGGDIYERPNFFFSSCTNIRRLLDDYEVNKYFCYVESSKVDGQPKGLDDLLIALPGKEQEIIEDLTQLSRQPMYFFREDMTYNTAKIRKHFRLHNINEFVEYHCEIIEQYRKLNMTGYAEAPDLKKKEFVFNGTKYKWDEEKSNCVVVVPADAKRYFRVGDQYHEKIQVPNKYGQLEKRFHRRMKQTIIDDYGKRFVTHIPKFKAFCNVPDHTNYQEVISSCYNMYYPFEHEPTEGEYTYTMSFLEHIFGKGTIRVNHKTKGWIEVKEIDLGLDYIQLLFQQPQQTLPILCLVSRENGTGKTTFAKWLKMLFTENAAIVGNSELANDFNASWAGKLLVICDETKIDKLVVVERVKSLSTADKIFMNSKGKDHVEIDFFAKFLFLSNNEENFIYAGEDDVRYWVRKIPVIQELFVGMLEEMKEEIPAFLHFLNTRKMATEQLHRAWFYPELIKTEALKRVIEFSQSTVEKELRQNVRDMFFDHGSDEILMTLDSINETFFRNKWERNYLRKVLTDKLKVEMYHTFEYAGLEYKSEQDVKDANDDAYDPSKLQKRFKTIRHSFPKWELMKNEGKVKKERVYQQDNGRPYVFKIEKFLLPAEIETRYVDDETKNDLKINSNEPGSWGAREVAGVKSISAGEQDNLPF